MGNTTSGNGSGDPFGDFLNDLSNEIGNITDEVVGVIGDIGQDVYEDFIDGATTASILIFNAMLEAGDVIVQAGQWVLTRMSDLVRTSLNFLKEMFIFFLGDKIEAFLTGLISDFSSIMTDVENYLNLGKTVLSDVDIWENLLNLVGDSMSNHPNIQAMVNNNFGSVTVANVAAPVLLHGQNTIRVTTNTIPFFIAQNRFDLNTHNSFVGGIDFSEYYTVDQATSIFNTLHNGQVFGHGTDKSLLIGVGDVQKFLNYTTFINTPQVINGMYTQQFLNESLNTHGSLQYKIQDWITNQLGLVGGAYISKVIKLTGTIPASLPVTPLLDGYGPVIGFSGYPQPVFGTLVKDRIAMNKHFRNHIIMENMYRGLESPWYKIHFINNYNTSFHQLNREANLQNLFVDLDRITIASNGSCIGIADDFSLSYGKFKYRYMNNQNLCTEMINGIDAAIENTVQYLENSFVSLAPITTNEIKREIINNTTLIYNDNNPSTHSLYNYGDHFTWIAKREDNVVDFLHYKQYGYNTNAYKAARVLQDEASDTMLSIRHPDVYMTLGNALGMAFDIDTGKFQHPTKRYEMWYNHELLGLEELNGHKWRSCMVEETVFIARRIFAIRSLEKIFNNPIEGYESFSVREHLLQLGPYMDPIHQTKLNDLDIYWNDKMFRVGGIGGPLSFIVLNDITFTGYVREIEALPFHTFSQKSEFFFLFPYTGYTSIYLTEAIAHYSAMDEFVAPPMPLNLGHTPPMTIIEISASLHGDVLESAQFMLEIAKRQDVNEMSRWSPYSIMLTVPNIGDFTSYPPGYFNSIFGADGVHQVSLDDIEHRIVGSGYIYQTVPSTPAQLTTATAIKNATTLNEKRNIIFSNIVNNFTTTGVLNLSTIYTTLLPLLGADLINAFEDVGVSITKALSNTTTITDNATALGDLVVLMLGLVNFPEGFVFMQKAGYNMMTKMVDRKMLYIHKPRSLHKVEIDSQVEMPFRMFRRVNKV